MRFSWDYELNVAENCTGILKQTATPSRTWKATPKWISAILKLAWFYSDMNGVKSGQNCCEVALILVEMENEIEITSGLTDEGETEIELHRELPWWTTRTLNAKSRTVIRTNAHHHFHKKRQGQRLWAHLSSRFSFLSNWLVTHPLVALDSTLIVNRLNEANVGARLVPDPCTIGMTNSFHFCCWIFSPSHFYGFAVVRILMNKSQGEQPSIFIKTCRYIWPIGRVNS